MGTEIISPATILPPGFSRVVFEHLSFHGCGQEGEFFDQFTPDLDSFYRRPLKELTFHNILVKFPPEEKGQDNFQVFFAESSSEERISDISLIVGTRHTRYRLSLTFTGGRQDFGLDGGIYRYYPLWRKFNPQDQDILIASRDRRGGFHILENRDGHGYYSPHEVSLRFTEQGQIVLVPRTPPNI